MRKPKSLQSKRGTTYALRTVHIGFHQGFGVIVQFSLISLVNIGAGFGLAAALGRRYRRRPPAAWVSFTVDLPQIPPAPLPAVLARAGRRRDKA